MYLLFNVNLEGSKSLFYILLCGEFLKVENYFVHIIGTYTYNLTNLLMCLIMHACEYL